MRADNQNHPGQRKNRVPFSIPVKRLCKINFENSKTKTGLQLKIMAAIAAGSNLHEI